MNRRRFLFTVSGHVAAAVVLFAYSPSALEAKKSDAIIPRLKGEYGFLSCAIMGPQSEAEIRDRVSIMAREYGIREFLFYDWFADYSTPTTGDNWTDPYFHRYQISRRTIEISIDEIHHQGGRAWAYVQAVGAEEENLEDPKRDLRKLRNAKGEWYWHPPNGEKPRFPTYFANAAWARHMVERWAGPVKQLGFDGIHWDTLGKIAGDHRAETTGLHDFIRATSRLLRVYGLRQTMNMVDLAWWDGGLVRNYLEFPYAEIWSSRSANLYYAEMDEPEMAGIRGVLAMYPSVAAPVGSTPADVICTRRAEALKHRLTYLVVGDGARRMQNEYWPATVPLTPDETICLHDPR